MTSSHNNVRDELLERLESKYDVNIHISPPRAPVIVEGLFRYPLNDPDDTKTVTIDYVGDLDCGACRTKIPVLLGLIKKYNDRIQFNYVPMAATPSLSTTIGSACNKRGKFVDLLSLVYEMNPIDSAGYFNVINRLDISPIEVQIQDEDESTKLQQNFSRLSRNKVTSTPTILVNGGIYYGEITQNSLTEYLGEYFTGESDGK